MIVDLFSGPGGWDEGLREVLVICDVIGVELDPYAVATRTAAGHATVTGDVSALEPAHVAADVDGLIASPPCPLYSAAGSKRGRRALGIFASAVAPLLDGQDVRAEVIDAVTDMLDEPVDEPDLTLSFDNIESAERAAARAEARDAALVLEPARWIALARPHWVALEQVPSVLPLWETYAEALCARGWYAVCGMVNAADYGVPQTRRRAVLLASRDRPVSMPSPTHADGGAGGLLPWVSMAEALDWPADGLVGFPRRADRDDIITIEGIDYRARDMHSTDGPAPSVTEKIRSWHLRPGTYATPKPGEDEPRGNRRDHHIDEPAPTIAFGHDAAAWQWVLNTGRDWKEGGTRDDAQTISLDRPAPTVGGVNSQWQWRAGTEATRVTVDEAAVLQTFPTGYPWTGPLNARYQQVGNAVPPRLAAALISAVM